MANHKILNGLRLAKPVHSSDMTEYITSLFENKAHDKFI